MKKHLFKMGRITATPGALDRLKASDIDPQDFLKRHVRGDWGDMDEHDKTENDLALTSRCASFLPTRSLAAKTRGCSG